MIITYPVKFKLLAETNEKLTFEITLLDFGYTTILDAKSPYILNKKVMKLLHNVGQKLEKEGKLPLPSGEGVEVFPDEKSYVCSILYKVIE